MFVREIVMRFQLLIVVCLASNAAAVLPEETEKKFPETVEKDAIVDSHDHQGDASQEGSIQNDAMFDSQDLITALQDGSYETWPDLESEPVPLWLTIALWSAVIVTALCAAVLILGIVIRVRSRRFRNTPLSFHDYGNLLEDGSTSSISALGQDEAGETRHHNDDTRGA